MFSQVEIKEMYLFTKSFRDLGPLWPGKYTYWSWITNSEILNMDAFWLYYTPVHESALNVLLNESVQRVDSSVMSTGTDVSWFIWNAPHMCLRVEDEMSELRGLLVSAALWWGRRNKAHTAVRTQATEAECNRGRTTCRLASGALSGSSHSAGPESLLVGPACGFYTHTHTHVRYTFCYTF